MPTQGHRTGPKGTDDPRLPAAVDLLGHTGADQFVIRYCEEDQPLVWITSCRYGKRWEVAAATSPLLAVFRLCDQLIDGGTCQHCHRPTGFSPDADRMPADQLVCWYRWAPRAQAFQRGCLARSS